MTNINLVPRDYWGIPTLSDIEDDLLSMPQAQTNNIRISEDDKHVHIEAAVPGINREDVEITYDHGILWIRGETKEEEKGKKRKYYRKALNSFSYKIAVPGDVDQRAEPEASCENGIVTITFQKSAESMPKKISVKNHKMIKEKMKKLKKKSISNIWIKK